MQVERKPNDRGAVPALEPRRPLQGDIAERSYVVGPDEDRRPRHTSEDMSSWRPARGGTPSAESTVPASVPGWDGDAASFTRVSLPAPLRLLHA